MNLKYNLADIYEDFELSYFDETPAGQSDSVMIDMVGAKLMTLDAKSLGELDEYTPRHLFNIADGEVLYVLVKVTPSVPELQRYVRESFRLVLKDYAGNRIPDAISDFQLIPLGTPDYMVLQVVFDSSVIHNCLERSLVLRAYIGEEGIISDGYYFCLKDFKGQKPRMKPTNFFFALETDRKEENNYYLSFKAREWRGVQVAVCVEKEPLAYCVDYNPDAEEACLNFLEYECRVVDSAGNQLFSNFGQFAENPYKKEEWYISEFLNIHSLERGTYYCCIYFMGELVIKAPFGIGELKQGRLNLLAIQPQLAQQAIHQPQAEALKQLQDLVGLKEVKAAILRNLCYTKLMKAREQFGLQVPKRILHTVMAGSPGTGKTTVARILGSIYHEMGILSKGHLVEVNREALTGSAIGESEKRTKEYIDRAKGGILFVDEAYALAPLDWGDRDFGRHVLDTLMPVLSDSDDLIVVFAGYSDEMRRLFDSNPGLASRFPVRYDFKDYSLEELLEMARLYFSQNGFSIHEEALQKMKSLFREAMKMKGYGNGRFVKTFIENTVLANMAERLSDKLGGKIDDPSILSEILPEDVPEQLEASNDFLGRASSQRKQVKGFAMYQ